MEPKDKKFLSSCAAVFITCVAITFALDYTDTISVAWASSTATASNEPLQVLDGFTKPPFQRR